MAFHPFDTAALPATPWKNGGGTTREIVCRPEGAGLDGFDWRVSIARIDAAGPFSAFAGVDRVIMLLDGAGVTLRSPDGRIDHRLDTPHRPFAFSGDAALACELLGAGSTDFNVMTRRDRRRAEVCVLGAAGDIAPAAGGVLLALRGRWQVRADAAPAAFDCSAGTGLWWDGERHGWHAGTLDADAALVAVRIDPTPANEGT